MRKSVAAWQLLQRLSQAVDERSLNLLTDEGYVRRERSAIPVYVITDKGREALRHRNPPEDLSDQANTVDEVIEATEAV